MSEIEKTCKNCEHELEDTESHYCRHCIHSAIENFEPKKKKLPEKEIRNKAIDDFAERLYRRGFVKFVIDQIAKEMRGE